MTQAEKQICVECDLEKPLSEFFWSKRKQRATKRCIACSHKGAQDPMDPKLIAIFAELELLMTEIRKATFEELVKTEWDEQAMRLVMRALLDRASGGDANAIKLIIDTRLKLRAEGDGSEDDALNLAQLLATDPLTTGSDSE